MTNYELKEIKEELMEMKEILKSLQKSGEKMDNHIDFIEKIYTSLRRVLFFLKTNIEKVILGSEDHLIDEGIYF